MTTEIWWYRARCQECGWASPEVRSLRTPCPRWIVRLLTTLYYMHRYLGAKHNAWEWSR